MQYVSEKAMLDNYYKLIKVNNFYNIVSRHLKFKFLHYKLLRWSTLTKLVIYLCSMLNCQNQFFFEFFSKMRMSAEIDTRNNQT
jgi:hypothetical protein